MYVFYTSLICIKLPLLYRPPNGTPPDAAAVSFTKFKEADIWGKTVKPLMFALPDTKSELPVILPEMLVFPLKYVLLELTNNWLVLAVIEYSLEVVTVPNPVNFKLAKPSLAVEGLLALVNVPPTNTLSFGRSVTEFTLPVFNLYVEASPSLLQLLTWPPPFWSTITNLLADVMAYPGIPIVVKLPPNKILSSS